MQFLTTNQLRILDGAGQLVPAQFRVLGRWNAGPGDATRPIRWLEVHFAADVPANATATYTLDVGGAGNAPAALQATQTATAIEVTTGPARFRIDRNNFDLFSTVWLDLNADGNFADAERVVVPDTADGSFVQQGGTEFRSNREAPRSVILEESGPLRAVVRAEGFHSAANGDDLLRYVTRLTFFAGQSYVHVDHTIIEGRVGGSGNEGYFDNDPTVQQVTDIDRAGLRVHLQLSGAADVRSRGAQDTVRQATLAAGGTAEVLQHRLTNVTLPMSYEVRQNGVVVESGQRADRAWLDLADDRWGLAVGTRYFFEKNPQRLAAAADGTVQVEFPAEPYRVYQAMGLGDEAVFYFHPAGTAAEQVARVLEGFGKDRLLAVAPPAWMVASGAFGDLPAANLPAPYDAFDTFLEQSYTQTVNYINAQHANGLLHYLDLTEDSFITPNNPDFTPWGNSYYDPAGAWIKQFARTGQTRWLKELAFPYVRQQYTTNFYDTDDPDSYQNGVSGGHGVFHREVWTAEYHYLESLWPYYYLTGDRRALERGLTAARTYANAAQYDLFFDYGIGTLGPTNRILAQKFNTMLEGWLASGDAALRTALDAQLTEALTRRFTPQGFLFGGSQPPPNPYLADQSWMTTHLMFEAVYKYFLVTGDVQARAFVVTAPQRIARYHRVSQDPASPDYFQFYNNVLVTVTGGGFTTAPFLLPDRGPDNFLYPWEVLGLGTALARAGRVLGDAALFDQARALYQAAMPASFQPGVWDKDVAKTSLRAFDGLALLTGTQPPPTPGPAPTPTPPRRPLRAELVAVKRGKKKVLQVRVTFADTGERKGEFTSPFQKGAYTQIQAALRDADGDADPDFVVVSARKGKKRLTREFPV